ncbi:transcription factor HEC1 [Coffea eugenioides]|uniref:transcription factor HEC1 n=1 Tax=Coffea eugenioides TaxID=49369 RepID=UPI000F60A4E3|nr:transcription factor HEC1 [Coffea eugenioides]
MERKFPGGGQLRGYSAGVNAPAMLGLEEAYLNGYFSDLSFQSILQPPCHYDNQSLQQPAVETPAFSQATYGYYIQDVPESSTSTFSEPNPTTYQFLNREELKTPKHEVLDTQDFAFQLLKLNETTPSPAVSPPEPLINFFSTCSSSMDDLSSNSSGGAGQFVYQTGSLSDIMNVQVQQLTESSSSSSRFPTHRVDPGKRYVPYNLSPKPDRKRIRQKISEKTRCLQRVLPWDKKMDMGTMLEEAYKYVKFLQAQISVLQTMPEKSSTAAISSSGGKSKNPSYDVSSSGVGENNVAWGDLGKLNRQQLLEVVVNSRVAQTALYSRGCCVYSTEQLVLLKKMAEKKTLSEQVLFASPLLFS